MGLGDLPGGSYSSQARDVSYDGAVIVGDSQSVHGYEAFRWTEAEGMIPLFPVTGTGLYNRAEAVSADGSVVVGYVGPKYQAFRWTATDGLRLLGDLPGGHGSHADAISPDGSIIGGQSLDRAAFVWNEDHGMRNFQDLLVGDYGLDLAGWTLRGVDGIATRDDVVYFVGQGKNPQGRYEGFFATLPKSAFIPEPVSLVWLALGTLMVRRRKSVK